MTRVLSAIVFLGITFFSCKDSSIVSNKAEGVQWKTIQEGLAFENKDGKQYLVQIETDSCKWCTIMHEKTFTKKELADYINENYIPIRFNSLVKDSLLFRDTMYKPIKLGNLDIHGLADKWLNYWYNYPTLIIFDKDFNQIIKFSGYKDPDQFLLELKKM